MQQTHKKVFNQHEKWAVNHSSVNRYVEVPSSTILLGQWQKNVSTLMKTLCSIRYLACQRLPLRSHADSESNFGQLLLLQAEDDPNFQK